MGVGVAKNSYLGGREDRRERGWKSRKQDAGAGSRRRGDPDVTAAMDKSGYCYQGFGYGKSVKIGNRISFRYGKAGKSYDLRTLQ